MPFTLRLVTYIKSLFVVIIQIISVLIRFISNLTSSTSSFNFAINFVEFSYSAKYQMKFSKPKKTFLFQIHPDKFLQVDGAIDRTRFDLSKDYAWNIKDFQIVIL